MLVVGVARPGRQQEVQVERQVRAAVLGAGRRPCRAHRAIEVDAHEEDRQRGGRISVSFAVRLKSSERTRTADVVDPTTGSSSSKQAVSRRSSVLPAAAIAVKFAMRGSLPLARHRRVTVSSRLVGAGVAAMLDEPLDEAPNDSHVASAVAAAVLCGSAWRSARSLTAVIRARKSSPRGPWSHTRTTSRRRVRRLGPPSIQRGSRASPRRHLGRCGIGLCRQFTGCRVLRRARDYWLRVGRPSGRRVARLRLPPASADATPRPPATGLPPVSEMRDVFISHASADKDIVARPLAEAPRTHGYSVWTDSARSIDRGLTMSRCGVAVLSPDFFERPGRRVSCPASWLARLWLASS